MSNEKCINCVFYDDSVCRRFPPKVNCYEYEVFEYGKNERKIGFVSEFPEVNKENWCGEFKEKKSDEQ